MYNNLTKLLKVSASPHIDYMFPAASAPARDKTETFSEYTFWTEWYNRDTNNNGDEGEYIGDHQRHDPKGIWSNNLILQIFIKIFEYLLTYESYICLEV